MNPHLTYYVAQAHTADLIREAQRQRLAGAAHRQQHKPANGDSPHRRQRHQGRHYVRPDRQHPTSKLSVRATKYRSSAEASRGSVSPPSGDG